MPWPTDEQDAGPGGSAGSRPPGARKGLTRRRFVISLGAGATAGIAGYFLLSRPAPEPSDRAAPKGGGPGGPALKKDVVFGSDGAMTTITRPGGAEAPVCGVNRTGAVVLKRLDGRHAIVDIARAVADEAGVEPTDALNAKVAYFVAQLAMLEFIEAPFYAQIVEHVEA